MLKLFHGVRSFWYHWNVPQGYLTVTQVAERLNLTRQRVLALIKAKRLPAEKLGSIYIIKEIDLDLVKDRRPGNPKFHKD